MSFTPRIKNRLTFPQLKLEENKPIYVKPTGPLTKGKEVEGSDMEAPLLLNVVNLETGEEMQIVVGKVLEDILTDLDEGYIDKCFMITQGEQPEGKRWRPYSVAEIAEESE